MTHELTLHLKETSVPILVGKNIVFSKDFLSYLRSLKSRFVIITDHIVKKLYGERLNEFLKDSGLDSFIISLTPGDSSKTRETKAFIEDQMLEKKLNKETTLIALGGGMVLDMAAFVAATYFRGIDLIMLPTSLLAMVDACIGGKTALNTKEGKNLIGTFYHPKKIFIDSIFLSTLPKKEYTCGLAEIIKYGIICDPKLFYLLESKNFEIEDLIYRSCQIKKEIVERDEREKKERYILNFGHTLGHSLEALDDYQISHGEAVSLGMIFASFLSVKMKLLKKEDFLQILNLFKKHHFPLVFSPKITSKELFEQLLRDKKARESARFVLIEKIGSIKDDNYVQEVDEKLIKKALYWFYSRFSAKAAYGNRKN